MIAKIKSISLAPANLQKKMQSFLRSGSLAWHKFCNHFQPVLIYWIVKLFPSEVAMWLMARLRLIQLGGKQ